MGLQCCRCYIIVFLPFQFRPVLRTLEKLGNKYFDCFITNRPAVFAGEFNAFIQWGIWVGLTVFILRQQGHSPLGFSNASCVEIPVNHHNLRNCLITVVLVPLPELFLPLLPECNGRFPDFSARFAETLAPWSFRTGIQGFKAVTVKFAAFSSQALNGRGP